MAHLSALVYGQGAFGVSTFGFEGCLVWLWEDQGSMLSSVFQFKLPALGEDSVLQDLVHSFSIETSSSSGPTFLGLGCGAPASHVFGV